MEQCLVYVKVRRVDRNTTAPPPQVAIKVNVQYMKASVIALTVVCKIH